MRTSQLIRRRAGFKLRLIFLALPLALLLSDTIARAQPVDDSVPPSGQLLAPAPAFSQWVVTFINPMLVTSKDSSSPPPPLSLAALTKTITTKTADIVHEEIVVGGVKRFDNWQIGPAQYTKDFDAKVWSYCRPTDPVGYAALPPNGFRDLDWIAAKSYVGTIKRGDRYCLVFVPGAPHGLDLSKADNPLNPFKSLSEYALIDAELRLPVLAREKGMIRLYEFKAAPTEKQTLPPDLAQVIKDDIEIRARLSQLPPRPY